MHLTRYSDFWYKKKIIIKLLFYCKKENVENNPPVLLVLYDLYDYFRLPDSQSIKCKISSAFEIPLNNLIAKYLT